MTYVIYIAGEDPKVPSTDAEDARAITRKAVSVLQKKGHRISSARVNGRDVLGLEKEESPHG